MSSRGFGAEDGGKIPNPRNLPPIRAGLNIQNRTYDIKYRTYDTQTEYNIETKHK